MGEFERPLGSPMAYL